MKIVLLLNAVPWLLIFCCTFPVAATSPLPPRRELPAQTELDLGNNL